MTDRGLDQREAGAPGRALVVGVGTPLMGDDGLGVEAARRLAPALAGVAGVEVEDGGTWGMQLLPAMEAATHLVVLDAIVAGREPGALVRLDREELPRLLRPKLSPHQIDLAEVFALMELRGTFPGRAVGLGIEPARVEFDGGLSEPVEAALPRLLAAAVDLLGEWGFAVPAGEAACTS